MGKDDKLPPPTPEEEKKAEETVKDWLAKQGYPDPDPKKQ
jgi:hypothetical protein